MLIYRILFAVEENVESSALTRRQNVTSFMVSSWAVLLRDLRECIVIDEETIQLLCLNPCAHPTQQKVAHLRLDFGNAADLARRGLATYRRCRPLFSWSWTGYTIA